MTPEQALYQLTHHEEWLHENQLPVVRRGGNPVWDVRDAGIVVDDNLCRVWVGNYLGDCDPKEGEPVGYPSPEALLAEWAID
jgi:hypothetical protein